MVAWLHESAYVVTQLNSYAVTQRGGAAATKELGKD